MNAEAHGEAVRRAQGVHAARWARRRQRIEMVLGGTCDGCAVPSSSPPRPALLRLQCSRRRTKGVSALRPPVQTASLNCPLNYLNALDREKRRCLADVSLLLLLRITSLRRAASLPQRSAARSVQQPQLGPLGSPAAAPPAERAAGSATRSRLVDYYSLRSRALDHVRCRWPIGSGRAAASLRWPGARSRSPGTRSAGREQATPAGRRLPRAYHIR
jgi:hypothetical protein